MKKQILSKTKEIIYRASLVILLGMFLCVFRYAFLDYRSMPFLEGRVSAFQKGLFMGVGMVLLILLSIIVRRWMEKISDNMCRILIGILLGVLLICQFIFLYSMKIQPRYDALKVLDEAVSLCKTGTVSPVHLDGYFARYTNNYPILFLTSLFLKIGQGVGIVSFDYHGAVFFLGIVNMIAIDAAICIIIKLVKKLVGIRGGLLFTLFVCINPLFIIWVPFYYTNTLAMPFIAMIVYLFYYLFVEKKCDKKAYSVVIMVLLGIVMVVGIKIRATTVLTCIACGLYFLLSQRKDFDKIEKNMLLKENAVKVLGIFIGILVAVFAYKVVESKLISFDYKDSAFPAIHWINMGAAGTGEYNIWDEQNTMSYATAEEKASANWESFFVRLEDHGFWGYINLLFQKLKLTFGDAGAGYRGELGVSDAYNDLNMYLVGGKSDFVGYTIQLQYVFSLLCVIYVVIKLLINKKCFAFEIVFLWNIAGAFVFHMLWEAGNIYSLSFALLFPCSVVFAEGLNIQEICFGKVRKPLAMCGSVGGVIMIVTVIIMIKLYPQMTQQPYETNDGVVNQYIYHWGESDELQLGEEVIQSFCGNREFNRIAFQVRNLWGQENDGVYHIQLLDEKRDCLQEFEICAKNYGDYDFVRLETDVISELNKNYYLRIAKVSGSETSGLVFLSYHTGNYDAYSYGELQNGEKLQDLCFSLYMTKNNPYCKKTVFGFVAITILFVEGAILILYYLMEVRGWERRKRE